MEISDRRDMADPQKSIMAWQCFVQPGSLRYAQTHALPMPTAMIDQFQHIGPTARAAQISQADHLTRTRKSGVRAHVDLIMNKTQWVFYRNLRHAEFQHER